MRNTKHQDEEHRVHSTQYFELPRLLSDEGGAVLLEYTIIVGTVAIAGSLGLLAVGVAVVSNFEFVRGLILCAIP